MADLAGLGWPLVVLISILTTLFLFRTNIAKLIDRADKAKVPGVELSAPAQAQVATDPETPTLPAPVPALQPERAEAAPPAAALPPPTPIILQVEESINGELEARAAGDIAVQRATTVRALAIARVLLAHEANYRVIFSTQIMLLKALNDRSVQNSEQARFWYDVFHSRLPDVPITFEAWLGFLQNAGYIIVGAGWPAQVASIEIDPFGQDFLLWMIHNRISEVRPG